MRSSFSAVLLAALIFPTISFAQSGVSRVQEARSAQFKALGASFKAVNEMLRRDKVSQRDLMPRVRDVRARARALPGWFPKGSGLGSGGETKAKPEIWTNAAGFRTAAQSFAVEATRLETLVRQGNMSDVADQVKIVGRTCATCHATFRIKQ